MPRDLHAATPTRGEALRLELPSSPSEQAIARKYYGPDGEPSTADEACQSFDLRSGDGRHRR